MEKLSDGGQPETKGRKGGPKGSYLMCVVQCVCVISCIRFIQLFQGGEDDNGA